MKTYRLIMNGIFFFITVISVIALLFISPEGVLSAMLAGGQSALELTLTMITVYALWMGILKVAEDSGITDKLARALKRPIKKLFGSVSEKACGFIAMNVSANLLGMGGVATPMGINAAKELDRENKVYAMNMLFVLAATSIQLLPTSVITLRQEAGSASPADIILPTLIATVFSTLIGVIAVMLFIKKK